MDLNESEEVAKVARGERAAFARLMTVHAPAIEAYALRISANHALAQDVVQEVMLRFWSKAASFDPTKARLTTWLHHIAHNLCIDHLRVANRFADARVDRAEPEAPDVNESPCGAGVESALGQLPERQRNALVLTYYQELSNREVAEIMGLSTRAVESLLVRARASLKEKLEAVQ